jgi:hypothetical protein
MTYCVFAGCSYTSGAGFALEKNEPKLWVNQIHREFFPNTHKLNVSCGGRSNAGIFQDTVTALTSYTVEYAIIEWTSMPRYELELGFELYNTRQVFLPNGPCTDHNLNDVKYSKTYLNSIRDRFTSLAHNHYEILNVIQYINTIVNLAKISNTKVFFVNGLCPWDQEFFNKKHNVLPSDYTVYTQQLLHVCNRNDEEIFQLYEKLHNNFTQAGGIHEQLWLNLYSSMDQNRVDFNSDQIHPGFQSNDRYVKIFSKELKDKLC